VRFLFSVQPAAGHLQPIAPVARELGRRGHDVRLATAPSFCDSVRTAGLAAMPVGVDWTRANPEVAFPELAAVHPARRYDWILRHVYAGLAARRTAAELIGALAGWRPDAIVRDQMEFGSLLAAELAGVPHASYGYGQGLAADDRRVAGRALAPLRAELGLDPDLRLDAAFRFMRLEFAPPSYLAPSAPREPGTHHIRPEPAGDRRAGEEPRAVAGLRRPLVVVTLGTNYNRTPGVFEVAVEALGGEPVDALLTVGENRDPADLGPLPSNVHAVRYAPLSALLPRAELTVCHGGFNTVMTAVAAGTPLVLVPIDSDQPAQARRCAELGLGRVVEPAELSPERLRREIRAVRGGRGFREATASFAAELAALPSTADAADLVERLAAAPTGRARGPRSGTTARPTSTASREPTASARARAGTR
jgi:UDP:flavonoid glycosyltransferase YjiC (YdhE family)